MVQLHRPTAAAAQGDCPAEESATLMPCALASKALAITTASAHFVSAQVEIESNVGKRFITFQLHALKSSTVNLRSICG